ncbi:hypothetical protein SEVIR_8G074950v4 [Setaria viridis]
MLECLIWDYDAEHTLCDLGSSVSIMPKVIYDKLNYRPLRPIRMCLQMANSSNCYPVGIIRGVSVKIRNIYLPMHFAVLDMEVNLEVSHILGRPFLNTTKAKVDVRAKTIPKYLQGEGRCESQDHSTLS